MLVLFVVGAVAPATRAAESDPSKLEREFVGLLNAERLRNGLPAVQISPALTNISDDYVEYNSRVGGIDHGRDAPYTNRANRAGCGKWSGPVLAVGFPSPRAVLRAWLNSSGHRRTLLDPEITHIGPGFKGRYALAYGMPCDGTSRNTSGDYGSPKAIGRHRSIRIDALNTSGGSIGALVGVKAGSINARLVATRSGRTVQGDVGRVTSGRPPTRLRLKVPDEGEWRVVIRAHGHSYAVGTV